jgi:hypothetical protein
MSREGINDLGKVNWILLASASFHWWLSWTWQENTRMSWPPERPTVAQDRPCTTYYNSIKVKKFNCKLNKTPIWSEVNNWNTNKGRHGTIQVEKDRNSFVKWISNVESWIWEEEQCSVIQLLWLEGVSERSPLRTFSTIRYSVLLQQCVYKWIEKLKKNCTLVMPQAKTTQNGCDMFVRWMNDCWCKLVMVLPMK